MLRIEKISIKLDDHIGIMKRWASEFVIALNLCPFAKKPYENNRIDWKVCEDVREIDYLIEDFFHSDTDSVFFILPFLEDFDSFLDVAGFVDHILEILGYNIVLKVVLFHPDHQYEGSKIDNEINYANRSPFPAIQLLRNKQLSALGMTEEWKNQILENNEQTLKKIGLAELKSKLDGFKK